MAPRAFRPDRGFQQNPTLFSPFRLRISVVSTGGRATRRRERRESPDRSHEGDCQCEEDDDASARDEVSKRPSAPDPPHSRRGCGVGMKVWDGRRARSAFGQGPRAGRTAENPPPERARRGEGAGFRRNPPSRAAPPRPGRRGLRGGLAHRPVAHGAASPRGGPSQSLDFEPARSPSFPPCELRGAIETAPRINTPIPRIPSPSPAASRNLAFFPARANFFAFSAGDPCESRRCRAGAGPRVRSRGGR